MEEVVQGFSHSMLISHPILQGLLLLILLLLLLLLLSKHPYSKYTIALLQY